MKWWGCRGLEVSISWGIRLFGRFRGAVSSGHAEAVAAEGEHRQGDEGVAVFEAERDADDEADLGVRVVGTTEAPGVGEREVPRNTRCRGT
jgi:hypothetical protein